MHSLFPLVAAVQQDGLTVGEILHNIPHDGPAVLVYALVAMFIGFIWHGSRRQSR